MTSLKTRVARRFWLKILWTIELLSIFVFLAVIYSEMRESDYRADREEECRKMERKGWDKASDTCKTIETL